MKNSDPSVFVGSSVEGLSIAEAIQLALDHECEVTIWSQGIFGLGEGSLESLVNRLDNFDFAILVLTADDLTESRGAARQSPRDNVLFELGLFLGRLGRRRTFAVFDRSIDLKVPTDLAGVTMASYRMYSSGDIRASVGAACAQIKQEIRTQGPRLRRTQDVLAIPAIQGPPRDLSGRWIARSEGAKRPREDILEVVEQSGRLISGYRYIRSSGSQEARRYYLSGYFTGDTWVGAVTHEDPRESRALSFLLRPVDSDTFEGRLLVWGKGREIRATEIKRWRRER